MTSILNKAYSGILTVGTFLGRTRDSLLWRPFWRCASGTSHIWSYQAILQM